MATLTEIPMDEAMRILAPIDTPKADTALGIMTLPEKLQGCTVFGVSIDGREVGAAALRITEHSGGDVLWIMGGAGGVPGADMVRDVLPEMERTAAHNGCAQVAITTRRKGLVKKMEQAGYEITGYTLRKRIKHAPSF